MLCAPLNNVTICKVSLVKLLPEPTIRRRIYKYACHSASIGKQLNICVGTAGLMQIVLSSSRIGINPYRLALFAGCWDPDIKYLDREPRPIGGNSSVS